MYSNDKVTSRKPFVIVGLFYEYAMTSFWVLHGFDLYVVRRIKIKKPKSCTQLSIDIGVIYIIPDVP